jgi:hypothetical protein
MRFPLSSSGFCNLSRRFQVSLVSSTLDLEAIRFFCQCQDRLLWQVSTEAPLGLKKTLVLYLGRSLAEQEGSAPRSRFES